MDNRTTPDEPTPEAPLAEPQTLEPQIAEPCAIAATPVTPQGSLTPPFDSAPPAPLRRAGHGGLLSYLLVGLVGAVMGGFLVIGIAPQVLLNRAGLVPIATSGGAQQPSAGSGQPVTAPLTYSGDPWESVMAVAERVSPAVVGIVNKQGGVYDFFGREYMQNTSGSGLIVTSDGFVVTNNHVVDGSKSLMVYLADGRSMSAKVVGADPNTDLAVLKIDATGLPTGVFGDSDQVRPGQLAVAIGNPLGMDFSRTVTAGIVSGLNRIVDTGEEAAVRLIQTDAVINPGNSGGPLANAKGEVIGLTSMKLVTDTVEGMGFAIPSNMVSRISNQIIQTGKVKRAQIGVTLANAEAAARQYSLKIDRGAYVTGVTGSAAQKAGLKAGDVITEFNGTPVNSVSALRAMLAERAPGDTVTLTVIRGSQQLNLDVALGEAP